MNSYETIKKVLQEIAGTDSSFVLSQSEDGVHGDYATNISFALSKQKSLSPKVYAEEILPMLLEKLASVVEKIEVAGPGFINFFLKDEVVRQENTKETKDIITKYTGKNILVEHSSPNLFKPFHIGHLMNNIVGEFVTRAMKEGGAQVQPLSFPSDISLGIAKAVYVLEKDGGTSQKIFNDLLSGSVEAQIEVVTYLGECYVRGVALSQESPELENEIKDISRRLYDEIESGQLTNSEGYQTWSKLKTINTVYFQYVLESIGSQLGKTIFESDVAKIGKDIVLKNIPEVFTESDGAVVYIPQEERKDINTSVFINSEGHPTYEAKDLGLIQKKFTEYGQVDTSYFVTDIQQAHHFKVVLDAASKLGNDWKERVEKSIHVPHGRMLFKGQKMSSRLGGVPLALDVIGVVEEEVRERAGEKIAHLGEEEKKELEREIALSALRIAVLRSKPGININFDPETSLSFEGDSGPYLLYTHARCCSLLEKGKDSSFAWDDIAITSLEKKLLHFERELVASCEELAPQKLVSYLFSVAQLFNGYYAMTQILVEGDDRGNAHRLMIVKRTQAVLEKGLYVLGVKAPKRM